MQNIAVFGASGRTGVCVVEAALERGLNVRALVRDVSKLPEKLASAVSVIQGDVMNIEDVKNTLLGQDAVVVCLGTPNHLGSSSASVMSEGLKNIIVAMDSLYIEKVSVCLSMFLLQSSELVPPEYQSLTVEHRNMQRSLESSDLLWVGVNPPLITDTPPTGYTSRRGANTMYSTISKYDLAHFLLDSLSRPELYQKMVGVASIPPTRERNLNGSLLISL